VNDSILDEILMKVYNRNLTSLHMYFIKRMRRHGSCDIPVRLPEDGKFVSGFIWTTNESGIVTTRIFRNSEIPEIIHYNGYDAAWNEFLIELLEAYKLD
jgi:hypothetical protein